MVLTCGRVNLEEFVDEQTEKEKRYDDDHMMQEAYMKSGLTVNLLRNFSKRLSITKKKDSAD